MARQVRRISELPVAGPLTGDELLEIVQGGGNKQVRVGELPGGGGGGAVQSVQGRTGNVVITADDVGLGSVDDTSDADKPVSTAQQAALDGKVDKVAGMGLSSNDFTSALKDKLTGLEGTHWRGTFVSLAALQAGVTNPRAGDYADVDTVGADVVRYIWDASDSVWVAQSGAVAPITASQVKQLYESNSDTNAFTDAEKSKLGGIEAGAQVNTVTSVNARTGAVTGLVENTDERLTDAREWSEATVPQAEAETGTASTRRAWTAQRVRQAIAAWYLTVSTGFTRTLLGRSTAAQVRGDLGLGTAATRNVGESGGDVMGVGAFGIGLNGAPIGTLAESEVLKPTGKFNRFLGGNSAYPEAVVAFSMRYDEGRGAEIATNHTNSRWYVRHFNSSTGSFDPALELLHTGNILTTTGQSTSYPMTQKAVTDELSTKADTSALGTAATRDVGESSGNVLEAKGSVTYPATTDIFDSTGSVRGFIGYAGGQSTFPSNLSAGVHLVSSSNTNGFTYGALAWRGSELYLYDFYGNMSYTVTHTGNIQQTTGQSTKYPMSQKAVTDAINARGFPDASGILTAASGALSNDMSTFLSLKTKAEIIAWLAD